MTDERPGVPLVYVGADQYPAVQATTFGIIGDQEHDEFVLTVGQLQLPQLLGTDEEKAAQAERLAFVAIHVVGRFAMTRSRVEQLADMLRANLEQSDRKTKP
jgi:hypothetical protein